MLIRGTSREQPFRNALVDRRAKPISPPDSYSLTPFKINSVASEKISQLLMTACSSPIEFPDYTDLLSNRIFRFDRLGSNEKSKQQFQFSCFDIGNQPKTSDDFMGSFMHVQEERNNPFDINVRIPSLQEYSAYSNILSIRKSEQKPVGKKLPEEETAKRSRLLSELHLSKAKSQIRKGILKNEDSFFLNMEPILSYEPPERLCSRMWQNNQEIPNYEDDPNANKLVYSSIVESVTQQFQNNSNLFFEPRQSAINEQTLIGQLCKALQGIETALFKLDHSKMKWLPVEGLNARVEHYFKNSMAIHVESILQTASCRSQIKIALEYLRANETSNKFIYSEISSVYEECMLSFEAILIECQDSPITFMQFELSIRHVMVELKLLNRFLLKEPLPKSFDDFDLSFIHTEKDLFYMAYNRLKLNDYSQQQHKQLITRLALGGFKCILYSLNIRLHHSRKQWDQLFYKDNYFTLFFEERRDIVDKLSDRLNILHNEDYQVYSICRQKKFIELKTTYAELIVYEKEWNRLVEHKRNAILTIEKRIKSQRQKKNDQIYQQKAKQIIKMKLKLAQRLQNDSRLNADQQQKQRQYIHKLQSEIKRKQQEQKLNRLIQIERQKGFLLDGELQEKRKLINHKYELFAKHPVMIRTLRNQNQINGHQLKKTLSNTGNINSKVLIEVLSLRQTVSLDKMEQEEADNQPEVTSPAARMSDDRPQSYAFVEVMQDISNGIHLNKSQSAVNNSVLPVRLSIQTVPVEMQEDIIGSTICSEAPLKTAIQVCVNQVILKQLSIVNCALASMLYTKHNICSIFKFMRNFFLSAKGHYIGDLIEIAVNPYSSFKLGYLKDSYFNEVDEEVLSLKPTFYSISQDLSQNRTDLFGELNLIEHNLEMKVGFEFKDLPYILKPYFSHMHLAKYMEIFTFILRLRHCVRLTEIQWKSLNNYERYLIKLSVTKPTEEREMIRKLHHIRYIIQACLNRLQNYLYFNVIEEEYSRLEEYLKAREFQQLPDKHLNLLNHIIIRGFINNPQKNISADLRVLFSNVREFNSIVTMFCLDDVTGHLRSEVNSKLNGIKAKCKQFQTILDHIMGDK